MTRPHDLPDGRDIFDAAEHLAQADDERLQLLVRHDPDMIRDVAKAVLNSGLHAVERLP